MAGVIDLAHYDGSGNWKPVLATGDDAGALIVAEQSPAYEQYSISNLGSLACGAGLTVSGDAAWSIAGFGKMTLLLKITSAGAGVASVGVEIGNDATPTVWYRLTNADGTDRVLAAGLIKTGGAGGAGQYSIELPAGITGQLLRLWVKETGSAATVTVAAYGVGLP